MEADDYSIQVVGFSGPRTPRDTIDSCGEHWVPECLRAEYESWITSEVPFIFSGQAWCAFLKASRSKKAGRMVRRSINNAQEIIAARSARLRLLLAQDVVPGYGL
jgi:hypothetical protein